MGREQKMEKQEEKRLSEDAGKERWNWEKDGKANIYWEPTLW